MEQKKKIRIDPEALPTPKLVGQLRRQKRKNRYKVLELGTVMSRIDQLDHDKKAVQEYDIERGRFVKRPKPAVTVDSYKALAAKWLTARLAYAFGLVLPWEVTHLHGNRVKQLHAHCPAKFWPLIEQAEKAIRQQWVLDIGTVDHTGRQRTFETAAAREHDAVWTQKVLWKGSSLGATTAAEDREHRAEALRPADEEEGAEAEDHAPSRPPKSMKKSGKKIEHVTSFMRGGKRITICKDYNKKTGCARKDCRYKSANVCSVKG